MYSCFDRTLKVSDTEIAGRKRSLTEFSDIATASFAATRSNANDMM